MGKSPAAQDKVEKKPAQAPAAHGEAAHGGEHKKPVEHKKGGKAAHTPAPGGCASWGCKVHATRFNFCDEHYDHFKFGLIKKTGEQVPDYEKKFGHYTAYKAKRGVQKAA